MINLKDKSIIPMDNTGLNNPSKQILKTKAYK